jgi:hypothetical protein
MSVEDVVVVATVREEIRSRVLFADTAEIERRIEAAQVKVVAQVDDHESEGEAEYVADTISKEGGWGSAPRPLPVSPDSAFSPHPGPTIILPPSRSVTPQSRPVTPVILTAQPPGKRQRGLGPHRALRSLTPTFGSGGNLEEDLHRAFASRN